MKPQTNTKISSLVAAMALAGAVTLPTMAMAQEATSNFSIFLRTQAEVVNAGGDIPEATGRDGWHVTDGWADGKPNSNNWSALFLDAGHQINDDLSVAGRFALNFDMNGQKDSDRDIYVSLRSKMYGNLSVGRIETPYKTSTIGWDPLNATFLQARGNQGRSSGAFGHSSYLNSSLLYQMKLSDISFSAFVSVDDAPDTVAGETNAEHAYSFAISAPLGPVEFVAAYIDGSEYRGGPDDRDGTKLGLRYSSGPWTLAGQYEMRGEGLDDGDFAFVTGSYKMGKWTHSLNYGQFMDDRDGRDDDGQYVAIGTRYSFARIAAIHFGYRLSDRDVAGDESMFGIGIRVGLNTGNLLAR